MTPWIRAALLAPRFQHAAIAETSSLAPSGWRGARVGEGVARGEGGRAGHPREAGALLALQVPAHRRRTGGAPAHREGPAGGSMAGRSKRTSRGRREFEGAAGCDGEGVRIGIETRTRALARARRQLAPSGGRALAARRTLLIGTTREAPARFGGGGCRPALARGRRFRSGEDDDRMKTRARRWARGMAGLEARERR